MLQASKRYANNIEGALDESIALTKFTARAITSPIKSEGYFDIANAENIINNIFGSSAYTTYTFLYPNDSTMLNAANVRKEYRSEKEKFGIPLFDIDTAKASEPERLQFNEKMTELPVAKRIAQPVKAMDLDTIYVRIPVKVNFGKGEFIGANMAMPIFDPKGDYIGPVGFAFDLNDFSNALFNTRLDLFEGDYRVLSASDSTIAVHENSEVLLKNVTKINKYSPESSVEALETVKANGKAVLSDYTLPAGRPGFAAATNISTIGNSGHWSTLTIASKDSVLAPLRKM